MAEKCIRGAVNQCPKLPLQVRFDFEEFELESSKASSCDVDAMTLINSPDGSGGTFCGFKGRDFIPYFDDHSDSQTFFGLVTSPFL